MWLSTLLVVLFAIVIQMVLLVQESPVSMQPLDNTYNIIDLTSPSMAGLPLTIFSYIVTRSPLRPFIIRFFLKKNHVDSVRQLAASLPPSTPLLSFPMTRLSEEDYQTHVEAASTVQEIKRRGLHTKVRTDSPYRSVMDYRAVYESRKATPSQVIEKVLEGCTKLAHLHIFSALHPEEVRAQAKASTARYESGQPQSIWDGVPVAVKEEFPVAGHRKCSGSKNFCAVSEKDGLLVQNLRAAGAIVVGVTVMTEGGVTPLGYSLAFDGPLNPYDTGFYPGGSSGGSGVAVASGLVPMAVGMDGGGSIRVPASMSGTFGLATTYGRVSTSVSHSFSVVKQGPIAATAQDAALAHLLLSEPAPQTDFYNQLYDGGVRGVPPAHVSGFEDSVSGMRLGVYWEHFQHSDPEVVEKCIETLDFLRGQGAEIVNVTIPHIRELHLAHAIKILSEFGFKWDARFHSNRLEANTEITVAMGKTLTAVELLAAGKVGAWGLDLLRQDIFRDLRIDAIVSPTLGQKIPKPMPGYRSTGESNTGLVYKIMRFIPLANLLGLPAMSVPVGYEKETGLPIGFQLLGDAWMEHKLLRVAATLEAKFLKRQKPKERYFDPLAEWMGS